MQKVLSTTLCGALAFMAAFAATEDASPTPSADPTSPQTEAQPSAAPATEAKPGWYDTITVGGDFRLRYEGFSWADHYDDGRRDRFRYRLRFGLKARVLDTLTVGVQLRSGSPANPISDNQTIGEALSKHGVSIAEAYADWQPTQALSVIAGKFAPPEQWGVSDMQWDDDVLVEGAMETLALKPGGAVKKVDVSLYQYVLRESSSSPESYLFGGQIAPTFALGKRNDLRLGAGYESVSNPERVAALYFADAVSIDSEHVTNFVDPETGRMISDFRVASAFLELKNKSIQRWPIKATLFLYKNLGAGDGEGAILEAPGGETVLALGRGSDNDTAWFGRVQVGDYKKPGQVAVRLSRYYSEPDALFFAFGQSDTRRASNVDAYRADLRVGGPKSSYLNVTYYRTEWVVGNDSAMHRWQVDTIIKF